jgi:hypothetical protein
LVKDGKINKKQAEALDKVFPPRPPQPRGEKSGPEPPPSFSGNGRIIPPSPNGLPPRYGFEPGPRPLPGPGGLRLWEEFGYRLDILEIAGVITENQAGAILRKLRDVFSPSEKRVSPPGPEKGRYSPLEALVDEGILTRDQAEVVGKVLLIPPPGKVIEPEG